MKLVKLLSQDRFDRVIAEAQKPVIVDFGADWCPPCRALEPVMEEIARDFNGTAEVYKVDIESNAELAARFSIRSLPTVLVFKNGKMVEELFGKLPKETYVRAVGPYVSSSSRDDQRG